MANAFLQLGTRRTNVKEFLKDASSQNSIKYKAEKGKTHIIYFPFKTSQDMDTGATMNELVALSGKVHEWTSNDGKFHATMCTDGVVLRDPETGKELTDGTCPFCNRISDSWDIYRYRYDLEERSCGKVGDDLKKHMEAVKSQYVRERKTSEARDYLYVLVVLMNTDTQRNPILGDDNLPTYELKIMKMSASRLQKIQSQAENNGVGIEGSEIMFSYPNDDDQRQMVLQCATSIVFPSNKITAKYPQVLDKINAEVAKFDWEGLDKAFPEWKYMSPEASKKTVEDMFVSWDKYLEEKKINGDNAKYLEYTGGGKEVSQPALDGRSGVMPQIGGSMPQMGGIPQMGAMPQMGGMPQMSGMPTMNGMPQMGGNGTVEI